jgi:hypothetical protein
VFVSTNIKIISIDTTKKEKFFLVKITKQKAPISMGLVLRGMHLVSDV